MTERTTAPATLRAGFTLVEMLVSMTVLALILVLMAQLFEGATRATTQGNRTMDIATEARLTLDRLGADLASMVRRSDVDYKFDKKSGNDALAFYAETAGYNGDTESADASPTPLPTPLRTLATLDYRIHTGNEKSLNFKLERGALRIAYPQMLFTDQPPTYAPGSSPFNTLPMIPAANYTVLASQIFRLEFCYLLKDGKFSKTPNPKPSDPADPSPSDYRPDAGGFKRVAALVVAIGMLDARNRVLLGDPKMPDSGYHENFSSLVKALPDVDPKATDASASTRDILSVWQPQVLEIAARRESNTATLPRPVTSNIRVYQRIYPWR